MRITTVRIERVVRFAALSLAFTAAGCGLTKQEEPALSGPSEFGLSISVAASTDRLSQDGLSTAEVVATVRDQNGQPKQGVTLQWFVSASTGVLVEPSAQQSVSDAGGHARMWLTAPPAPAFVPITTSTVSVTARPLGGDALSTDNSRTIVLALVPPAGTLLPNRLPNAAFTVAPATGIIYQTLTFDASDTRDEGEPCPTCSYKWDFGDFEHADGQQVTHSYTRPGTFSVTLTVADPRGGVGSRTQSVSITGPAAPTAAFTATPSTVTLVGGGRITFVATNPGAVIGATIEEYTWNFGDGSSPETTSSSVRTHTYAAVGSYVVQLTVKDNFGRTAFTTGTVTVTP
jgi:PKD repeat protein